MSSPFTIAKHKVVADDRDTNRELFKCAVITSLMSESKIKITRNVTSIVNVLFNQPITSTVTEPFIWFVSMFMFLNDIHVS